MPSRIVIKTHYFKKNSCRFKPCSTSIFVSSIIPLKFAGFPNHANPRADGAKRRARVLIQTSQPERVKNLEIFFSSDKKSGDFTKSSENELI